MSEVEPAFSGQQKFASCRGRGIEHADTPARFREDFGRHEARGAGTDDPDIKRRERRAEFLSQSAVTHEEVYFLGGGKGVPSGMNSMDNPLLQ